MKWRLLMAVIVSVGLSTFGVAPALAVEAPAWKLTSVSTPTNFAPNTPRDESQSVTVDATGGSYTLDLGGQTTTPLAFNASATEVQSALEALVSVGAENVTVSGGPGSLGGATPYVVTFVGGLGHEPIALMTVNGASLSGGGHSVTVKEEIKGRNELDGRSEPEIVVTAGNVGGTSTDGSPITIIDKLPAGLTATSVTGYDTYSNNNIYSYQEFEGMNLTCAAPPAVDCTYSHPVDPGDTLILVIGVHVAEGAATNGLNDASITGGGALEEVASSPVVISDDLAPFGVAPGSLVVAPSTLQAGAHANLTTAFTLNTDEVNHPAADTKDIRFDLPTGFVGNTVGMPQCTMSAVKENRCAKDTMVGMATLTFSFPPPSTFISTFSTAVYNIRPAPGEPAAFAFSALVFPVRLDTSVLSNGEYNVRVTAPDLSEAGSVISTWLTVWGVPADHNGLGPDKSFESGSFGGSSGQSRVPLLTNPQQCSRVLSAEMSTDSWSEQGVFISKATSDGPFTGCALLPFTSSFSMLPDTLEAGAPAGYSFDLKVAQENNPDVLATPNVKNVSLALPVGTVVNPSAAWGLKACSDAQFDLHSGAPAGCPREAQVGTVRIKSPALEEAFEGQVYLGSPLCDPCTPEDAADGRMVRLFVNVVGEGESGIVIKLEGRARIDQNTGQITTTFENNPQLPFSEFKLTLGGGPRAVLANPRACGIVSTNMDLTPWSTPFTPDSTPSYAFEVRQNCFGPQFNPSFEAGSTNIQSGEYSPFTLAFGRSDDDEFLNGLQMHMPAGLLGTLSSVALCGDAQAVQGTCGPESLIGHVQILTGPGADPFLVSGGEVFITGPYKGAPYGLSIVVPAVAGPYTLAGTTGRGTVVVRAAINVDPHTAALTVTSDPLPTALDGIPLQLKVVNVTIDRPGFTFNPTSCAKTAITGTLSSAEGASTNVSTPFQVTNCSNLAFKPGFKVSVSGRTSRANGASLDARLTYPIGPKAANIAKVKVDLPKQLPSRLNTLQQACPAATFNANPAACPPGSIVGIAKANTPILPVQLTGPVYFVSHAAEAFPNLIVVLQGYGVSVDLVGDTFISKKSITSSTFNQVPDVPINSFELYLPQGPHSALAANGNLCKSTLKMPTSFIAQNGLTIHQSTPIKVTGCAKAKAKAKKARSSRDKHKAKTSKGHASNRRHKQ